MAKSVKFILVKTVKFILAFTTSFSQLKQEIKDYMKYYNQHRYQWNLKKMTPVEYRNHLLMAA
ncbi:hypothetical protein CO726_19675 [Bacillus fungorum]|uniref:Integrase catalytic domain-containing protein n=1 Tax=Bacillus fungorum TaxID=2039284 RepID=A0A2G6Q9Z9_9BACI|nr:hypothetical protein CO726_19675 [Bacillus fungorum]